MTIYSATATYDNVMISNNPTTNYGTAVTFSVGEQAAASSLRRSWLYWDLSSIPADSYISGGTITIYFEADYSTNARTLSVYRTLRDCVETKQTWDKYDGTSNWTTAGGMGAGDYDSTAIGTVAVTASETIDTAKNIPLTTAGIEALLLNNKGVLLAVSTETDDMYQYHSRHVTGGDAAYGPVLTIDWYPSSGYNIIINT